MNLAILVVLELICSQNVLRWGHLAIQHLMTRATCRLCHKVMLSKHLFRVLDLARSRNFILVFLTLITANSSSKLSIARFFHRTLEFVSKGGFVERNVGH